MREPRLRHWLLPSRCGSPCVHCPAHTCKGRGAVPPQCSDPAAGDPPQIQCTLSLPWLLVLFDFNPKPGTYYRELCSVCWRALPRVQGEREVPKCVPPHGWPSERTVAQERAVQEQPPPLSRAATRGQAVVPSSGLC